MYISGPHGTLSRVKLDCPCPQWSTSTLRGWQMLPVSVAEGASKRPVPSLVSLEGFLEAVRTQTSLRKWVGVPRGRGFQAEKLWGRGERE